MKLFKHYCRFYKIACDRKWITRKIACDRRWIIHKIIEMLDNKIFCSRVSYDLCDYEKKFGLDDKVGEWAVFSLTFSLIYDDVEEEYWDERSTKDEYDRYEYSPVGYWLFFLLGNLKLYGCFFRKTMPFFFKSYSKEIYPFLKKSDLKVAIEDFSKNYDKYVPKIISKRIYDKYMSKILANIDEIIST